VSLQRAEPLILGACRGICVYVILYNMYVCVGMYMCMRNIALVCVYIYIYVCVYVYIYIYIFVRMCMRLFASAYTVLCSMHIVCIICICVWYVCAYVYALWSLMIPSHTLPDYASETQTQDAHFVTLIIKLQRLRSKTRFS
jgi:hypothetical protein